MDERTETDSMGEMRVPATALYGAQTRRAQINFPVSGWRLPPSFLHTLGRIKEAAARANAALDRLPPEIADAIATAAGEVATGRHDEQFVVDVFQTGSGTSTNMNANEVIANRAIQLLGGTVGSRTPVHPNDHVNLGQSSNDVIPTALQAATALDLTRLLLPAMASLEHALQAKAAAFDTIVKIGRTHLQDATPIRLGQVFAGYAGQTAHHREQLNHALEALTALPLGGTAVGTGINTHKDFGGQVAKRLTEMTGVAFRETDNHVAAQAMPDAVLGASGALKAWAISFGKIANDIRFLASGPRCGYGELRLPALQPGSSIMPGKVNPVICESVLQVTARVVGADAALVHAAATLSQFELSTALPLAAYELLESIRLLTNACRTFEAACLQELEADAEACNASVERSLALCTSLVPLVGYDRAAALAKAAYQSGRTIREVAAEESGIDAATLQDALHPRRMTEPEA